MLVVEGFVKMRLHRYAAKPESCQSRQSLSPFLDVDGITISLWNEFVGCPRIIDSLLDLLRHELSDKIVGLLIDANLFVVAEPHREARGRIQFFPEDFSLLGSEVPDGVRVIGIVHEPHPSLVDSLEHFRVTLPDRVHFPLVDLGVEQWDCL